MVTCDGCRGLTERAAAARRRQYGPNAVTPRTTPFPLRVLRKLVRPIPLMILLALTLSVVQQSWEDVAIIALLLVINVGIDVRQEQRAHAALAALQRRVQRRAIVLRNGRFRTVPARDLVPGDCIKLTPGAIVPADVVVQGTGTVRVDLSAITGESLPVQKGRGATIYGGAVVHAGEACAVVTATGAQTFMGRSMTLVATATRTRVSHFERAIIRIGRGLIVLSLFIISIVVAVAIVRGDAPADVVRFALVLAVASIPVALPAVLSVTMAIGALAIARREAIVARVAAVEELAGVTVLCTDKTGTVTENRMTVQTPLLTYGTATPETVIAMALLASEEENNDPLEAALFRYARTHHITLPPAMRVTDFQPFDPVRKHTAATVATPEGTVTIVKGAPQVIARMAARDPSHDALLRDAAAVAATGARSIAVARCRAGRCRLLGLIPLADPPRRDSRATIALLRRAGIATIMLTGDHVAIARTIAARIGMGTRILSAARLRRAAERHDTRAIAQADGFAEVFPEDKYRLVALLQAEGHIVAMTGDGVNDAPALRKADVGIAVSGATDAARRAADVTLLTPGLRVIHDAIMTARAIFWRMQSYATFRIAETIRVVLFVAGAALVFHAYPVTPIMLVILALLNDIPIMALAYDRARVSARPVRWRLREITIVAGALGIAGVLSSFGLFVALRALHVPAALIQTMIFLKLDVAGHSTIYLTRTGDAHFWTRPYPAWRFFVPAFASRLIGTLAAVYGVFMAPIGWVATAGVWAYALAWWIINDYVKIAAYRWARRQQPAAVVAPAVQQ